MSSVWHTCWSSHPVYAWLCLGYLSDHSRNDGDETSGASDSVGASVAAERSDLLAEWLRWKQVVHEQVNGLEGKLAMIEMESGYYRKLFDGVRLPLGLADSE